MALPSRAARGAVAFLLILAPFIAGGIKMLNAGWMAVILMTALVIIVPGYIVQVLIAGSFLRTRGALRRVADARRAVIAGWIVAVAPILAMLCLPDGGDSDFYPSPLMQLLGWGSHMETTSTMISLVFFTLCVGAWIWLVIEWFSALARVRAGEVMAS